jgi:SAM-dependent methyltransferase
MYAHRDDSEALRLSVWIASLYPPGRHRRILDLACGRGRHSLNLARLGFDVTGLDLSKQAIHIAETRAKASEIPVRFRCGDMRTPLEESFDGIVNLFTSFGYASDDTDNRLALAAMRQMLVPGGFLLIDYLNAVQIRQRLVPMESGTTQGLTYHIRRWIDGDVVWKEIRLTDADGDQHRYHERVKLYDEAWFRMELASLGFRIDGTTGDYDGSPYVPDTSARLIIRSSL